MNWRNALRGSALVVAGLLTAHGAQANSDVRTELVVNGLNSPLYVTHAPGDTSRIFIVLQGGQIRVYDLVNETLLATPFVTVTGLSSGGERGLLGLAFHPDYANNGYFYVNYTDNTGGDTVLQRYTVDGDPATSNVADASSAFKMLEIDQPFSNHNGGWIGFGPDDFLYMSTGDGGSGNDPGNRSQDTTNQLLGKMLRLDVNGDDFPADPNRNYAIPPSNPFVGVSGDDEIWSYGIRNAWRSSFDRQTGDLYIADVGQGAREEINVQPAGSAGGENYGWRCQEGSLCTGLTGCTCFSGSLTQPVHEYTHSVGFSITGGYVYRGSEIPAVSGRYFFADFVATRIWSFEWNGAGGINDLQDCTSSITPSLEGLNVSNIASFGEDANGEMYIVSLGGSVFRMRSAPPSNDDCTFSDLVSPGSWDFTNVNAAPSSTVEPCGDFESDVWFRIVVQEDCTLNLNVCDADFDSEIAVYSFNCPTVDNQALACSDEDCGTSSLSVAVTGPALYRIRVGSVDGAQGNGTLVVSCSNPAPCPWDCSPDNGNGSFGNGVVNIDDLLEIINSFGEAGGPCDNAPDNGDGTFGNDIVNIDDLLAVINNFGDCP
ncbi:MAG: PQQ-dependent sugar dehydrogenase [Planctomycetota bacterium]